MKSLELYTYIHYPLKLILCLLQEVKAYNVNRSEFKQVASGISNSVP